MLRILMQEDLLKIMNQQTIKFCDLSSERASAIDEVCDCFEHQLYTRNRTTIEELLEAFAEPDRTILFRELALLEWERKIEQGEQGIRIAFQNRFPQYKSVVDDIANQLMPKLDEEVTHNNQKGSKDPSPKIPGYRILRLLGQGGMGSVYEAIHTKLGNRVAIKIMLPKTDSRLESEVRFEREMKVVGTFSTPYIVQARDAGKVNGMHYLVMEYIRGYDLAGIVRRIGPLEVPDACEIARRVSLGLSVAHKHGLVHRDIKPMNVLLGHPSDDETQTQVKVADFGLAMLRGYQNRPGMPANDGIVGTFAYMAPEQYWNQACDIRSDIYALGCTLYYMLLGHAPFLDQSKPSPHDLMQAHRDDVASGIRESRCDVDSVLESLIFEMLASDPEDRPETPDIVSNRLNPFTQDHDLNKLLADADEISQTASRISSNRLNETISLDKSGEAHLLETTAPYRDNATSGIEVTEDYREPIQSETITATSDQATLNTAASSADTSITSNLAWLGRWLAGSTFVFALAIALLALTFRAPTIDVMSLIDPDRDTVRGQWNIANGKLVSPDQADARLELPIEPPDNYRLAIKAKARTGGRLVVGASVNSEIHPIVLDTIRVGRTEFSDLDGDLDVAKLAKRVGFESGEPSTYTVIINQGYVLTAFEDQILSIVPSTDLEKPKSEYWQGNLNDKLWIGAEFSVFEFSSITLEPL